MVKQIPQIATIIDDTKVIINQGSRDNVNVGDEFNIVDNKASILKDPTTDEILGKFNQYKQKIYVTQVEEKYSICTSIIKEKKVPQSYIDIVSKPLDSLSIVKEESKVGKKMKINPNEINNVLSKYNYKTIHVGDRIKKA